MRITFENRVSDFRAFGEFHYHASPDIRRSRLMAVLAALLLLPIIALMIVIFSLGLVVSLILAGIVVAWTAIAAVYHKKSYLDKVARGYREYSAGGLSSGTELTAEDSALTVKTRSGAARIDWDRIRNVHFSDSRTFIYTGPVSAIVIPKDAVIEGDYDQFVSELRSRCTAERE